MHAAHSFVRKIPRYPEKVALYLPRGTSCLAERIAAERGVSPKDLMREALAEALEAMAPTEPLVDEAPAVAGAVTTRNADEEARAYVEKTLSEEIAEPFSGVVIERNGQADDDERELEDSGIGDPDGLAEQTGFVNGAACAYVE